MLNSSDAPSMTSHQDQNLDELLVRVSSAADPDWDLVRDIAKPIINPGDEWSGEQLQFGGWIGAMRDCGAWTDIAIAITERALPGIRWEVGHVFETDEFACDLWRDDRLMGEGVRGSGNTPALAMLAALLMMLAAGIETTEVK